MTHEICDWNETKNESSKITIKFFSKINNAENIFSLVKKGEIEKCFINPETIISEEHLLMATIRARRNQKNNSMKTRTIESEILWCLSPYKGVGMAFKHFGLQENFTEAIVLSFEEQPDFSVIQGEELAFNDSILQKHSNVDKIKDIYQISEDEIQLTSLKESVIMKMSVNNLRL
ncbi:cgi-121 family member [Anaeramoeba flamelloides]|uniref:Cgi-121 family member n=1 Tax=Anaeramoeba flamelloides TaxID=1746091 RepID=A0AAV8ADG2_9EUKA|nr:cgi-121 family member [Anaeramoeba flamelloides]KAJ6230872.1 cgi-121 family member [Anaeramoeba flamelloides]